jgi:hypothetical protein
VDPNDIKTLTHQTSVTIADQRYDILIKRIGKDVKLAKTIQEWLADPKHPERPPLYKNRPGAGWKKMRAPAYFQHYYGAFVGALYRDELGRLDFELTKMLTKDGLKGDFDIDVKLPKKSARIETEMIQAQRYGLKHIDKVMSNRHK